MLSNNREIIKRLRRLGWSDIGCGSDEEPYSTEWCKCLSKGRRDKTSYRIIDWGCGYGRFLIHIIKGGIRDARYYGFELRGKTHGELLINFCQENYSHKDIERYSIKFGHVDNEELIEDAKNNCTTMLLGSVFTHLNVESSIAILERFDDFIVSGGEIIFSLILARDDKYKEKDRGVYENSDCFAVVYYSKDSINALTLNSRYQIDHICVFPTPDVEKGTAINHDIFRLTIKE